MNRREQFADYNYHGGPYERGGADSYYRRAPSPHKFLNGVGSDSRVTLTNPLEIAAYWAGYGDNEAAGDFKNWE